jgi:nickel-dependent lactate racemase
MADVELKYGSRSFACRLDGARVLTATIPPAPADPAAVVRMALQAPIGCPPLEKIVRPGEKVVIVTSDITRYTASELYLPILAGELNRCGIADADLTLLIGLGIHRRQTDAEHRRIAGALYGRVRIEDHDCDDPAMLVDLGHTAGGLPVQINRRVLEADRVIVTGTIGLHYFAGFGGGRKGLVPGVASRATCMATHFAIFNPPEIGDRHPAARPAVLEGNPVHEAILAAARMVAPDFLLNTVLTADKQLAGVFCGDLEAAHLAGCALARELAVVPLARPADLAVVSCGGHPKDINFIPAHKARDYGVPAVRPGGTVILLAACPDGFGNPTFYDWFRHQDLQSFEAALRQGYEINGQTAYATLCKARSWRIILISGFSAEQTARMGMEKAGNLDEALRMAYERLPADASVVVIPDGSSVLPVIKTLDP